MFFSKLFGTPVAYTTKQDNNSYLLSPEKGWSCPPRIGLFRFVAEIIFTSLLFFLQATNGNYISKSGHLALPHL
jgi:hypothetical protein